MKIEKISRVHDGEGTIASIDIDGDLLLENAGYTVTFAFENIDEVIQFCHWLQEATANKFPSAPRSDS